MKNLKVIILLICTFISANLYSQSGNEQIWRSGNVDTSVISFTSLNSVSLNYLYQKFNRFEAAIYCDSVLKIGLDEEFSSGKFILSKAGVWNYLGSFSASQQPDIWFRKAFQNNSQVGFQLMVWGQK